MKLILQAIKALFRKVENAIEDVRKSIPQADWYQNDPTAPDHVKNRTHYVETETFVLFENYPVNGDTADDNGDGGYQLVTYVDRPLMAGDLVTITVDDNRCDGVAVDDGPFCRAECVAEGFGAEVFTCIEEGGNRFEFGWHQSCTLSVTVTRENIHKIDTKYLPDGIPNEEQIAEIMKEASEPCLILETNSEYYDFASSASTNLLGVVRVASGSFSAVIQKIAEGKDPIVIFRGGVSTLYSGVTWEAKFCLKSKAVYYNKSNMVFLYFELETIPSSPSSGRHLEIIIGGTSNSIDRASYTEK